MKIAASVLLLAAPVALGQTVIIDQIGDGFQRGSQIAFSNDYDEGTPHDLVAVDNFTITERTTISTIETLFLLNPSPGFPVDTFRVNIYSDLEAAQAGPFGDVFVQEFSEPARVVPGVDAYSGIDIDIISFDLTGATLEPGEYWFSVMAVQEEFAHGQMITFSSLFGGDNVAYRVQATHNPTLLPVYSTGQNPGDLSYRVFGTEPVEEPCVADRDGDESATVQDLLDYLNDFRAQDASADITGEGTINVQDLLAYLSAFREGC